LNLTFDKIEEGVKLFNENEYFQAHDFFEELWLDSTGTEKIFLQALIQYSVAHFHLISGNVKGAKSLLNKCENKLAELPPEYCFVNLKELKRQIKILFNKIEGDFNKNIYDIRENKIPLINEVKSY